MSAWKPTTLTQLGSVGRGRSRHRPRDDASLYGGDYPFIQTGDVKHSPFYITTYSQTYNELGLAQSKLWDRDTLCITIAANIADTAILKFPACFPDSIIGFISDPEQSDVRFVKYCMETLKVHFESISRGTTQDNLSVEKLLSIKFKAPQVPEQKKIAGFLTAYDDLIEVNRRRIAALQTMAEELYREWFVRHRFPGHAKVKLVKGRPATWSEQKFGTFCVLQRGFDLPDAEVVPGPYPIIASTSIKGYHHEFKVKPPVVTTGRSGSLGEVMLVHTDAWPLNTALYVKDFCGNSPFLVYYTLKNMGLEKFNAGAGVPSLNRNHLTSIKLNVPDAPLQTRFDEVVGPIHEQKEQLVKMNASLRQTRDLLLPRLISGKLRVEALDIQFPPGMKTEE